MSSAPLAFGVHPYRIALEAGTWRRELLGTLLNARWEATFFAWSIDPRKDLEGWRGLATQPGAQRVLLEHLDLNYGWRGPGTMNLAPDLSARDPGPDHFGMIARARFELSAGLWRVRTLSDDGVRVRVDGKTVLENWSWHGPTHDTAEFEQPLSSTVELEVEHFEIDGFAVLGFELTPVREP